MKFYKIKQKFWSVFGRQNKSNVDYIRTKRIDTYLNLGRIPWSIGYEEYKWGLIRKNIDSKMLKGSLHSKTLPKGFGIGVDERCIEYPWIFSELNGSDLLVLDAGSTFNFEYILEHPFFETNKLSIFTYYPESECFYKKRISYLYGDLRDLPFKEELFDIIVSQSTIEHIDMDNSIYGYSDTSMSDVKSYDYLKAIGEYLRVLKSKGTLLVTFPFGKFENHGFFQQFDSEMLLRIENLLNTQGKMELTFFKYEKDGWRFSNKEELKDVGSYNPHTGKGKGEDGAAHCRSICCIKFIKN